MAEGGELVVPQEPYVPHGKGPGESFEYARPLVLWQFTKMADPRFTWGDDFIRMRQDNRYDSKQKFGAAVKAGWAAYDLAGERFVKHFPFDPAATYPDGGCNAEFFTMPGFLEIESLGPLAPVEPGDCVRLDERWGDSARIRSAMRAKAPFQNSGDGRCASATAPGRSAA